MPIFLTPTLLIFSDSAIAVVMVTFASVLLILGIWEKNLLFRARSWPIAQGTIDSAWVHEHKGKHHRWIARLDYSFPLQQRRYTGRYSKTFSYQNEADDFVRDLTGKSLRVHYSSRWPVFSAALKQDVEELLQTRPVAEPEPVTGWQPVPVSLSKNCWLIHLCCWVCLASWSACTYISLPGSGKSFSHKAGCWGCTLVCFRLSLHPCSSLPDHYACAGMFVVTRPAIF